MQAILQAILPGILLDVDACVWQFSNILLETCSVWISGADLQQKMDSSIFDKSITPCGNIVWMLPLIFFKMGAKLKIIMKSFVAMAKQSVVLKSVVIPSGVTYTKPPECVDIIRRTS